MDKKYIKQEIKNIAEMAGDPEIAHIREDRLFEDFARHVALVGHKPLASMAKEVLEVLDLNHPRWYA